MPCEILRWVTHLGSTKQSLLSTGNRNVCKKKSLCYSKTASLLYFTPSGLWVCVIRTWLTGQSFQDDWSIFRRAKSWRGFQSGFIDWVRMVELHVGLALEWLAQFKELRNEERGSWSAVPKVTVIVSKRELANEQWCFKGNGYRIYYRKVSAPKKIARVCPCFS
jgi:hypothetical protein